MKFPDTFVSEWTSPNGIPGRTYMAKDLQPKMRFLGGDGDWYVAQTVEVRGTFTLVTFVENVYGDEVTVQYGSEELVDVRLPIGFRPASGR